MAEVIFYIKNPNAKFKSAIYADFSYSGMRIQHPTGLSIHPNKWRKGKLKHQFSHEDWYDKYTKRLLKIKDTIESFYRNKHVEGITPSKESILEHLNEFLEEGNQNQVLNGFYDVFELFLKVRTNEVAERTIQKYKTLKSLLIAFEAKENYTISFDSINLSFFDNFKAYMYSKKNSKVPGKKGVIDPTLNKYISVLKTFMTWSRDRNYHSKTDYEKFSVPIKKKNEIITLSNQDISKIKEVKLENGSELDQIRDIFLFGFHTLQRWSDIENLSQDQVRYDEKKGITYWEFTSLKSNDDIVIPLLGFSSHALDILSKYDFKLPKFTQQKFNELLKQLGKKANLNRNEKKKRKQANREIIIEKKLYQHMSSHIMRRSGITYLLEQGVPITTIMKISGHEDVTTLMKYENTSVDALEKSLIAINPEK